MLAYFKKCAFNDYLSNKWQNTVSYLKRLDIPIAYSIVMNENTTIQH